MDQLAVGKLLYKQLPSMEPEGPLPRPKGVVLNGGCNKGIQS